MFHYRAIILYPCSWKDSCFLSFFSGALSKLKIFLIDCGDPESDTNKLIDGTKNATKKLLTLGKTYNKLAGFIDAPSIPLIGT